MLRIMHMVVIVVVFTGFFASAQASESWRIDTTEEWRDADKESGGLKYNADAAISTGDTDRFLSVTRTFKDKHSAKSIVFKQIPEWRNWNPIDNIGPSNLRGAPVLLTIGPNDYWIFGLYGSGNKMDFKPQDAELDGFDMPLKTTPFPRQYDAPGGLKKGSAAIMLGRAGI